MRKAGDVVSALFKDRFGPDFMESAKSTAGLFSSWEKIVAEVWPDGGGQSNDDVPAVAVHSKIRELEKGLLLVEADHPGWIQILRTRQGELLSVVQRRHPELGIRAIAFRLSRTPMPESSTSEDKTQPVNMVQEVHERNDYNDSGPQQVKFITKDEDFQTALKRLEESLRMRNSL